MHKSDKRNKYISIALVVLIIILFLLISSITQDIRRLHRNGVLMRPISFYNFSLMGRKSATLADIGLISGWMTFNYLNKSFNLPGDYLKTKLAITSPTYPNITILKTAKEKGVPINFYLATVKDAVSAFLMQNTPPQ
jgi:hypothetical protein